MARILITGSSGFVGGNLARFFRFRHSVVLTDVRAGDSDLPFEKADLSDEPASRAVVQKLRPEVIIHCAGTKDVKWCEANPDGADRVNAVATRNVAKAAKAVGAKLIYLSTDLVFDSQRGGYTEMDIPSPELVYGRSKFRGELYAMEETGNLAICRAAGVYGKNSPLLKWLAKEIQEGREVECFLDVKNTPTWVDNLGEMLEEICNRDLTGIFHTVGRQSVSRHDFFSLFAHAFGLDVSRLKPSTLGDRRKAMLLMPDSSLSSKLSRERLGVDFVSPAEGFLKLKASGGV